MRQILKIISALIVIILLISCIPSINSEWEIVKTFESLPGIAENKEITSVQVGFLNDKVGFAINRGNHVYYSNSSGKKWEETVVNTNPCIQGMDIIDENNIVIGCECSPVEYTSDKGKTWTKTEEIRYPLLSFFNKNSGLIAQVENSKKIEMLENFKNITEINLPEEYRGSSSPNIAAISCISTKEFYVLLIGKGILLKTVDGGKTWEKIGLDKIKDKLIFQRDITSMRFTDINKGIIISFYNKEKTWVCLETKDGGMSWKYSSLFKTNRGWRSYLSKDANYITILNLIEEKYPIVLLKRKI